MSAPPSPEPTPLAPPSGPPQRDALESFLHSPDGRLRPGLRSLLYFAPALVVSIACDSVVVALMGPRVSLVTVFTISRSISAAALLVLSAAFLFALDRRSYRSLGMWFYSGWVNDFSWGATFGAILMALTAAVLVFGRGVLYDGLTGGASAMLVMLLRTGVLFLVGAAMEEILFRGYGFQRLVDSLGAYGAVALTSILFGFLHRLNPAATPLSTANTVLAGVLLSVAYLRTRALWLPIGLHWTWNFFQGQVLSLPVSGIQFDTPLLHASPVGPAWLTGGNYGPEGGLAVTAVCLAGIVWLTRTKRFTPSPAMREVLQ